MARGISQSGMKWWQVALWIPLWPIAFVLFLVVIAVALPVSLVVDAIHKRRERRNEEFLGEQSRVADWADVKARVATGKGTVIEEAWLPKGPHREWWTEDDLIKRLDTEVPIWRNGALSHQKRKLSHVAADVAQQYTHVEFGKAKLLNRWDSRRKHPPPRVRDVCPDANVVTIVHSGFALGQMPLLFAGDIVEASDSMMRSVVDEPGQ